MDKNKNGAFLICALCIWSGALGQPILNDYPESEKTVQTRQRIIELAESQLYVREKTGQNDGPQVERYLRSVGLRKGNPWCAAFVAWVHIEANVPNPESGWSPDWFRANVVFKRGAPRPEPFKSRPAQVFGLWYFEKGRVAHVGIIEGETRLHYNTIEGNTNSAGSREGDGVYKKIRKKETIYIISDFAGHRDILKELKNQNSNEYNRKN